MKVGRLKRIPVTRPGKKQKRHSVGGYNWKIDTMTWTVTTAKNSSTFIEFLEELVVKNYPTGRIVLVMDNAAYHKSASALAALGLFEQRVISVWFPAYCSDLNPIERFWQHLKDRAYANKLQDNIEAVMQNAETVLVNQNVPVSLLRFHVS